MYVRVRHAIEHGASAGGTRDISDDGVTRVVTRGVTRLVCVTHDNHGMWADVSSMFTVTETQLGVVDTVSFAYTYDLHSRYNVQATILTACLIKMP